MQSLWMLVAAVFFSLYAVFVKFAGLEGLGSWEILLFRSAFCVVVFYCVMKYSGITVTTHHPWQHIIRSLAGTVAILCGIYSVSHLNIGLAMTLNYTAPLFIGCFVLVYAARNKIPVNWKLLSMVLLGFAGVVVLLSPTISPSEYFSAAVGIGAGFFTAVATSFVKRLGVLQEPESRIIFYLVFTSFICGLAGTLFTGGFHEWTSTAACMVAGLCICSAMGQFCLTRAFSRGNLVLSSSLQYTVILFSTIFGEVIFNEPIHLTAVIGMLMIVAAGLCASYFVRAEIRERRKASK